MKFSKIKNKKIVLPILVSLILISLFSVSAVSAVDVGLGYATASGLSTQDLRIAIMRVIQVVLGFLGVLAISFIVYAGFLWMTAGGNEEKISTAKKILINATIGLAIIFSAFMIASFIVNRLAEATGATGGQSTGSCSVPEDIGGISGCLMCSFDENTGYFWQFDQDISGCKTVNYCTVSRLSPSGLDPDPNCEGGECRGWPINSVIRIWFNHDVNSADLNGSLFITELDAEGNPVLGDEGNPVLVAGTIVISGRLVEFTPSQACLAPCQGSCFKEQTNYQIQVVDGQVECGGSNLSCTISPAGVNTCITIFKTGSLCDAGPPAVSLVGSQICQGTNELRAEVNDDYGIEHVVFDDKTSNQEIGIDTAVSFALPAEASVIWDTTGQYSQGDKVRVAATAFDYDANSTVSEEVEFLIRAGHCCNNQQDADEAAVDCGGAECEPCLPAIEWIRPLDGKAGSLITIHGRHFLPPGGSQAGIIDFIGTSDPLDDKTGELPSVVNPACTQNWSNSEVIIVVPTADASLADAADGPIKLVRSDNEADLTNDNRGTKLSNFDVNSKVRPGLCAVLPFTCVGGGEGINGKRCDPTLPDPCGATGVCTGQPAGTTNEPEILKGINFNRLSINICQGGTNPGTYCPNGDECQGGGTCSGQTLASRVYFASVTAGGTPGITTDEKEISGVTVPALPKNQIAVRTKDKISTEYSNPKDFNVDDVGEYAPTYCSTDPTHRTCTPDAGKCQPDEFCDNSCQCQKLIACDNDLSNNTCEPNLSYCQLGQCENSGEVCRYNYGTCTNTGEPCLLLEAPSALPVNCGTCQNDCPQAGENCEYVLKDKTNIIVTRRKNTAMTRVKKIVFAISQHLATAWQQRPYVSRIIIYAQPVIFAIQKAVLVKNKLVQPPIQLIPGFFKAANKAVLAARLTAGVLRMTNFAVRVNYVIPLIVIASP
jgi:hypothetical protein